MLQSCCATGARVLRRNHPMKFAAKYTPEQWAEARRLRAEGLTFVPSRESGLCHPEPFLDALPQGGLDAATRQKCCRPGKSKGSKASPATASIRRKLSLRLYTYIELQITMMELRMKKRWTPTPVTGRHRAARRDQGGRESFAALIEHINQVTEMASEPASAADGRRKSAKPTPNSPPSAPTSTPTASPFGIREGQPPRRIADRLEKISLSPEGPTFSPAIDREPFERTSPTTGAVNGRDDQLAPVFAKGGGRWQPPPRRGRSLPRR